MDFDFTTETITPDSTNILTIAGTGGIEIPVGTTAQRPSSPVPGTLRYNVDLGFLEVWEDSPATWVQIGQLIKQKGDLLTFSTTPTILHVGTNGYILTANSSATTGLVWEQPVSDIVYETTSEPTGFPNRTDSIISFNETTRVFTIAPVGTSFDVWQKGTKFTKTAPESVTIPNVIGPNFISYDVNGTLQVLSTFFDLSNVAPVAEIVWNSAQQHHVLFSEERHGLVMDWATHRYLHITEGTKYVSGLNLENYTTSGLGSLNSSAQIGVTDGVIADEDITITIVNSAIPAAYFEQILAPVARLPVIYKLGNDSEWYRDSATNFPLKMGTTYPVWNQLSAGVWSNVEATSGTFIATWILATNDLDEPVMAVIGQNISTSLEEAKTNNQFQLLNTAGIPFVELRPLYRLIFGIDSTYTNAVKSVLLDVVNIQISPSIQINQALSTGTVTSIDVSGGTTGLTTSGGPIITFGTITLNGTLNTTHGGTGLTSVGTANQLLGVNTGATALEYKTITAGSGITITPGAGTITIAAAGAGTGTVTSVAISGGTTGLTVSGSPITTSGTITFAGTLNATNGGTGFNTYAIGDILYAGTTSTLSRLADIATGNALISGGVGVAPSWGKIGLTTHVSGTLGVANGGTGLATTPTNGQLLIGNGTNYTLAGLTAGTGVSVTNGAGTITLANTGVTSIAGTAGNITASAATGAVTLNLATAGTAGTYATVTTDAFGRVTSGVTTQTVATGGTGLATLGAANQVLGVNTGATALEYKTITAGTGITITPVAGSITIAATNTNTGTVTSVGLALPSIMTVSGSPVTTTGTLTGTLATQTANTIFAGPTTGVAATPTFRALSMNGNDLSDVIVTSPTVNQTLIWNGADWVNTGGSGTGGTLRTWSGNIASQSGTSIIAIGGTAPLVTAGTQIVTQTITPLSTSSKFILCFSVPASASTNNNVHTAALFRGSTYLGAAVQTFATGGNSATISFIITDAPATVSPITYSIRYGTTANNWFINRRSGENTFGGLNSGWTIEEY